MSLTLTPPPLLPLPPYVPKKIEAWRQISMSQGLGNYYSFTNDSERLQLSAGDKLDAQDFEAVADAVHPPLMPIEEDDIQREMYNHAAAPCATNMLSAMFSLAGQADYLGEQSRDHSTVSFLPEFYAGSRQHMLMSHANHHHHGWIGAHALFGEDSMGFGGGVMERRAGGSLTLSSALGLLEMKKAEEQSVRSQGGNCGAFYYSSPQAEEQSWHPVHPSRASSSHMAIVGSFMGAASVLRKSKYAQAAQELLEELCSVRGGCVGEGVHTTSSRSSSIPNRGAASSSFSSKTHKPLSQADRFDNLRKKSKLLSMIDEVERRYRQYCEQMQIVVSSLETVMGFGAAAPYTVLAQKAMSRHFRSLKDAISWRVTETSELLGEKAGETPRAGVTKGKTPKLRLIDQSMRNRRAYHNQHMGIIPQRGLPDRSVAILRSWLFDHFLHPYPSDADKHLLARKTGLSRNQVSNWFINARVRLWKPMVEEMYQQEEEEEEEEEANEEELDAAALSTQHIKEEELDEGEMRSCPPQSAAQDASVQLIIEQARPHHHLFLTPTAAARSGDLSLTLGLRHAGGNSPDATRFRF